MKKLIFIIGLFIIFIGKVNASEYFYLGEKLPNFYIYMDRVNKKVNYNLKGVYRTINNELVYCIEPGVVLSSDSYDEYDNFNSIFNITEEKFNKIKLLAYYGYNYKDHTDIKWYMITQYLIWKEIKPDSWTMYISDADKNNIDYVYQNEIDEINTLIRNHDYNLGIENGYIINYKNNITINAAGDLSSYKSNLGSITNSTLYIDNLKYGRNDISLKHNNYNKTLFYYNAGGQNVFKKGDEINESINTYVYVTAGKIKINECNEEDFSKDMIGGTYEVFNVDDALIGEITCTDENCLSDYLPVGFFKIKVRSLNDNYEVNEHIYDIEVKDNEVSEINICSLKKKVLKREIIEPVKEDTPTEEEPYEYTEIKVVDDEEYKEVDVPSTSKYSYTKVFISLVILLSYLLLMKKNENDN